jgi:hypothetical protein
VRVALVLVAVVAALLRKRRMRMGTLVGAAVDECGTARRCREVHTRRAEKAKRL